MTQKRSKAHRARTRKIREFCVVRPDGRTSDTELHEPILEHGDDIQAREIGKNVARRAGLSDVENDVFDIELKNWRAFRRRLFYFGIDASTVMADLAGLGEALYWQYKNQIGIGEIGY